MIKDLNLLYDIAPLFEKELIIWREGYEEDVIIKDIREMGAGKLGITICDADPNMWGEKIYGIEVKSPNFLKQYFQKVDLKNVIVCILTQNLKIQDKILEELKNMVVGEPDIYTSFGITFGICYNLNSSYIDGSYRLKKLSENKVKLMQATKGRIYLDEFKYFAFLPLHNDEVILVYQPGKVASMSIYESVKRYGRNVLHIHYLEGMQYKGIGIKEIFKYKSAKIISLVREPVSRGIAHMWEDMEFFGFRGSSLSMKEVEAACLGDGFENVQAMWYDKQLKGLFGIDVLAYPFDKEKGYEIIKSGNIEVLLMKMEHLNNLSSVIGEFLGIEDFQLCKANIGKDKPYRFAYEKYKKEFTLSPERIEYIFRENEFVRHFYTEEECEKFIEKYKS